MPIMEGERQSRSTREGEPENVRRSRRKRANGQAQPKAAVSNQAMVRLLAMQRARNGKPQTPPAETPEEKADQMVGLLDRDPMDQSAQVRTSLNGMEAGERGQVVDRIQGKMSETQFDRISQVLAEPGPRSAEAPPPAVQPVCSRLLKSVQGPKKISSSSPSYRKPARRKPPQSRQMKNKRQQSLGKRVRSRQSQKRRRLSQQPACPRKKPPPERLPRCEPGLPGKRRPPKGIRQPGSKAGRRPRSIRRRAKRKARRRPGKRQRRPPLWRRRAAPHRGKERRRRPLGKCR